MIHCSEADRPIVRAPAPARVPISGHIKLLMLASMAPVLILAAVVIGYYARGQQAAHEQHLRSNTRSLAAAIDQKLGAMQTALETLADSNLIRRGEYERFYRRCEETASRHGGSISLQGRGAQIFSTETPYGANSVATTAWGRTAIDLGHPLVTDLFVTPTSLTYAAAVAIPIFRDGAAAYALSFTVPPEAFTTLLQAQNFPPGWRAAIVDRAGVVIARNIDSEKYIGKPVLAGFLSEVSGRAEGVITTTTLDGLKILTAFARTDGGWAIAVGVDRELVDAPMRKTMLQILIGGALLCGVTWSAGVWWARRLSRSAKELTLAAEAIGRGEPRPSAGRMWYREGDQLATALKRAGDLLALRGAERDAANIKLREQVVTMERRVEERTQDLFKALSVATKASQAKSDFLANMSHELRTPLNAVIGFAQLLEAKLGKKREGDYASYIHQAGEQLHVLINDILDLAKIESGQVNMQMEPTLLAPIFEQIKMTMGPMAATHNVSLHLPTRGRPWSAFADPTRLRQVLQNLISNAIKYNRPKGKVTVTVSEPSDDRLRIVVSDTGTGIPLDRQHQLFQAFNRLGVENSHIEGTGIGLTISRHLIQMMGGEIGFTSAPEEGSQFWIEIAAAEACDASRPACEDRATPTQATGDRRTILYIEDNPTNSMLMVETFRDQPRYRLLTAETGAEGLRMAAEHELDAILLDIRLPDVDGYKVLESLRAHPRTRGVPVIAVSAYALPSDLVRGLEAGFFRYLTKPYLVEDLLEALAEAVDTEAMAQYAEG